jgi:hypothetical protein
VSRKKRQLLENTSVTCNDFRKMYICDSGRLIKPNKFINKSVPVVLMNVGQVNQASQKPVVLVKDLPSLILIGKER